MAQYQTPECLACHRRHAFWPCPTRDRAGNPVAPVEAVTEVTINGVSYKITPAQQDALRVLCSRYHTEYRPEDYRPAFDLPAGWVSGWVGGDVQQAVRRTIYVGCDPEGRCHS